MSDVKTEETTQEGTGQEETKQINTGTGEEMTPKENGLMTQAKEWKSRAEQLEADNKEKADKLAKFEADVAAAAEKKALEEGKHLELIEQLKSEKAALELQTRQASITDKLRNAGMQSALALKGAVYSAPKDADDAAIEQWINDLKTSNPTEFQARPDPVSQTSVGSPSASGSNNWKNLKAIAENRDLLTGKDREERIKARELIQKYKNAHNGEYPPD